MISVLNTNKFRQDTKAVAPVVASIILLGFVVIGLAGFQAVTVPQQNAETEFQHFESVQNDMEQIVDAVADVEAQNRAQFSTIQLGATYQPRIVTINPPPAAGSLQTSDEYPITIRGENETENVSTRFLEYQPGYTELRTGSVWYENSRAYVEDETTDGRALITTNSIINSDGTLNIIALQNEFYESGTNRLTIELYPKQTGDINIDELGDELNVTIPTRLDENHWNESLSDELPTEDFEVREDEPYEDEDVNSLKLFDIDFDDLDITTVGIQSAATGTGIEDLEQKEEGAEDLDSENEEGNLIGGGATGEGQGGPGKFEFGIRNTGDRDLEIVGMGIINTTTDANVVTRSSDNQPRLTQDEDLIFDNIEIDDNTNDAKRYDFEENISISGGETVEEFEFNRFQDRESQGQSAENMGDSSINITVWVRDEDNIESQTTLVLRDE